MLNREANKSAKTAYLLFYTRELIIPHSVLEIIHCENQIVEHRDWKAEFEAIKNNEQKEISQDLPNGIKEVLKEEREANLLRQFMFHPDYLNFVVNLLKLCPIPIEENYVKKVCGIEVQIFAFIFFLTTAIRAEMTDSIIDLSSYINESCKKHKGLCISVAGMFSNADIIREFIIDCPKAEARKLIVSLLRIIMTSLYLNEKKAIENYVDKGEFLQATSLKKMSTSKSRSPKKEIQNRDEEQQNKSILKVTSIDHDIPFLILLIDALVQQANNITKCYCGQYFQILTEFCELGPECRQYLQSCRFLGVSLEILGLSNNIICCEYAAKGIPHFSWEGRPFIEVLPNEEPDINDRVKESLFGEQTQYIFYFLNQLIMCKERDFSQGKRAYNSEKDCINLLSNESSLISLFQYAAHSKYSLHYLCSFLLGLLDVKKEKLFGSLLDFLIKNILNCQYKEFPIYFTSMKALLSYNNDLIFQVSKCQFVIIRKQ